MQHNKDICKFDILSVKGLHSREAFCLRMLHKKYFNVSNRWYAPTLRVSKMAIVATNLSVMEVVFFFFPFVT